MTQLPPTPQPAPGAMPPPQPVTSTAAVVSLICGIFSLCTFGLTSIPGLIAGAVGLGRIGRSGGRMTGRGLAIGGIVTSAIGLAMGMVALCIVAFLSASAEHVARRPSVVMGPTASARARPMTPRAASVQSMVGMTVLAEAARAFAAEHDGRLPQAGEFPAALERYYAAGERPQTAPGREFILNEAVAGRRIEDLPEPGRTVLFFEGDSPGGRVGGRDRLRGPQGRDDAYVIAFADGHIEWVEPQDVNDLIWQPGGATVTIEL